MWQQPLFHFVLGTGAALLLAFVFAQLKQEALNLSVLLQSGLVGLTCLIFSFYLSPWTSLGIIFLVLMGHMSELRHGV